MAKVSDPTSPPTYDPWAGRYSNKTILGSVLMAPPSNDIQSKEQNMADVRPKKQLSIHHNRK